MERLDVAIVGGGPAGLAALAEFQRCGLSRVALFEREAEGGGIPRHCGHWGFGFESHRRLWTGPAYAAKLRQSVQGADLRLGATVLDISDDNLLQVHSREGLSQLAARHVLIATGTRETPRAARFLGGERPLGVMNTGALQQHVYLQTHAPFRRPVILGSEWVSFSALLTCRHLGIKPVAMIEEEQALAAPALFGLGARLAFGVPVLRAARLVSIIGTGQVEAVDLELKGQRRRIACDGVIVSGRFRPERRLVRQSPHLTVAGNAEEPLKTAGRCWLAGRAAARTILETLA
jgi:NADPH-dependent 2,4-dienoyl-CoA reductase/sulfur reductase-like enzyme